ncbi:hypothetical protein PG994_003750 [Apiospora phragmitis]|uniref:Uncharacterized protein n=1 Tax=Apiospora phragmitis TaxID=2905665 RepID=A0ABR1VZ43_9PEZI
MRRGSQRIPIGKEVFTKKKINDLVGGVCADMKVNVGMPFTCTLSFKEDGDDPNCGGKEVKKVTADKGKDDNGVELSDEVKFVQITCS